jgi:hypothetical protein
LNAVTNALIDGGYLLDIRKDQITLRSNGTPRPLELITEPYPGFPTDMQAQMCALLCRASGESRITEKIFPQRFMHVSELKRMGADISLDGFTAVIRGISDMSGAPVMASDLRASAALLFRLASRACHRLAPRALLLLSPCRRCSLLLTLLLLLLSPWRTRPWRFEELEAGADRIALATTVE